MEGEDHLYLTLPSSASMELYPDNKISDFKTELLNTIQLNREIYEVGLSEIILDADIENVPNHKDAFMIYRSVNFVRKKFIINNVKGITPVKVNGNEYYCETFTLKRGLYKSLCEILRLFNKQFRASYICNDLVFSVVKPPGEELEIVSLSSKSGENLQDISIFHFRPLPWFRRCVRLADYPAIDNVKKHFNTNVETFLSSLRSYMPTITEFLIPSDTGTFSTSLHFICDLSELVQDPGMAYVYTDIIEHQHVGNTMASLLRVVHFSRGRRVITFPDVHYLPLSKTCLKSIRIYIRDVEGRSYPFTKGTAVCKVHIRRKLR